MAKKATKTKKTPKKKNTIKASADVPTRTTSLNIKKADNGGYVITSYSEKTGTDTVLIAKNPADRNAMVKKLLGST